MFRQLSRHERRDVIHWPLDDRAADQLEWAGEIEHRRGSGPKPAEPAPAELWVRKGRCYVDGLLCENEQDIRLAEQADRARGQPGIPSGDGRYLVFLDVWERFISAVEDPAILELALGGLDTAARLKLVWQVKVLLAEAAARLIGERHRPGTLRARRVRSGASAGEPPVPRGGPSRRRHLWRPAHADDQLIPVKQIVAEHSQVTLGDWPSMPPAWAELGSLSRSATPKRHLGLRAPWRASPPWTAPATGSRSAPCPPAAPRGSVSTCAGSPPSSGRAITGRWPSRSRASSAQA